MTLESFGAIIDNVLAVQVLRDPDSAAAVLQPGRLRLLALLANPNTAAGLARETGAPRQQVNYHLRELERHGAVALVEERRKGNCMERVVRATARSYLVSPEALGSLGANPAERRDRFSAAYLVSAAARAIRDIAVLGIRARKQGKRLATLTVETEVRFRTADDRSAFAQELTAALATLAAKYHDDKAPGGRPFRFLLGGYPVITKQEDDGSESAVLE